MKVRIQCIGEGTSETEINCKKNDIAILDKIIDNYGNVSDESYSPSFSYEIVKQRKNSNEKRI